MTVLSAIGNKLRLGMIGSGFVAQVAHLHAFRRVVEVDIVAIADTSSELRDAVSLRCGIPRAMADYRELLDDDEIDAVVVCMPRFAQSMIVAEAVRAKRAVLSEKPMAMTVAEAEDLVESADQAGTLWAVGYMKRYDLGVRRFADIIRDRLASGEWGPVIDVDMRDFCPTYGVAIPPHQRRIGPRPGRYPEARRAPDFVPVSAWKAYEYTVNVASHDVNLLRMLFGDELVPLSFHLGRGGVQRALFNAGDFPIALTLGPGNLERWDQVLSVTFAKGRAVLTLPSPLARQESASIELIHGGSSHFIRVPNAEHVWAFEGQARAFAQSALNGTTQVVEGRSSIADLALIEGLWKKSDWYQ